MLQAPEPSSDQLQALGQSEAFMRLQERISLAAKTRRPVIFIGERGTGKELAARRLHLLSDRWNQEYVTLNCASLTPTLIESELFGHEAGAFTGALRQRKGRFELADEGSLFLDEIANIPMTVQEKILRTVEYGQMERVGGSVTLQVDVRLIAATNVDLRALAALGRFRQDLLDRLSFEVIVLPPLRARREDIVLLAGHFARRMAVELGLEEPPMFTDTAARALVEYAWPGNIRQLKNVVERMVYRTQGTLIDQIVFDPFESEFMPPVPGTAAQPTPDQEGAWPPATWAAPQATGVSSAPGTSQPTWPDDLATAPLPQAVAQFEILRLRQALEASRFNQRKAAQALGLTYHQLRSYWRKYRDTLEGNPEPPEPAEPEV